MDWDAEPALMIPPPAESAGVPEAFDWEPVELALGVELPTDYKRFLER